MVKNTVRKLLDLAQRMLSRLPEGRPGDFVYALFVFIRTHRRLPVRKQVFNDELFRIRTGKEIRTLERATLTDKELAKGFIARIAGDQYNIPTLAVLRSKEEVATHVFPARCCIKPTHMSGKAIIRRDGEPVDTGEISSWLEENYYRKTREPNYRHLVPKVIVEPLVFDSENAADYKFFCQNGQPRLIQHDCDRRAGHKRTLLDCDWRPVDCSLQQARPETCPEKPANLSDMLRLAGTLSQGFAFIRIDIYSDGAQCLAGEITNCHGGSFERFIPPEGEKVVSDMIWRTPALSP